MNPVYKHKVKAEIDKMLEDGIIEPVEESQWISPMVVQEKKKGGIRICVDLRKLNDSFLHDLFPTPFTDEVLENVGGQEAYSFTDGFSGYQLLHMILVIMMMYFVLLLGRDYVYAMKSIVSTLFRVISFPHDGWVVTIDQLSFIDPAWIASLNGSYTQTVSPPPQVNYVALSPMASTSDNLDPVVDMVISSIGLLEPNLFTSVATLDMVSFQSMLLPSSEDLLESMTEFCPLT
jgi:hypothetical protein